MNDQAVAAKPKTDVKPEAVAAPPIATAAARALQPLAENRIRLAHGSQSDIGNIWIATTFLGTPWEEAVKDAFWANKARDFRVGDRIWVYTDDMIYAGELLVQKTWTFGPGAINNRAQMRALSFNEFPKPDEHERTGEFEVIHLGPHMKWCLRSAITKKVGAEGFATQDDAERARRSIMASRSER